MADKIQEQGRPLSRDVRGLSWAPFPQPDFSGAFRERQARKEDPDVVLEKRGKVSMLSYSGEGERHAPPERP